MDELPSLPTVATIHERLQVIFPQGTPNRSYCTREMAASTVFVMLYVGAIEGYGNWLRPDQVTRMTDDQAAKQDAESRLTWATESLKQGKGEVEGRWYAVNSREPIRDETLREGLIRVGAVNEREGVPTTSPKPRYALMPDFAALCDPALSGESLDKAIENWQERNLSRGALARVSIRRRASVAGQERILVEFPNGETRHMEPGPSSVISKAVIEDFAQRFLEEPAVVWLSESRNQVVARDDALAQDIGLTIQPDRYLPDIIMADLGPAEPLLIFIEVVATAGEINESRQAALLGMARDAGFREEQVGFVTAYEDRDTQAFKSTVASLTWRSFAWFMAEPDNILVLHRGATHQKRNLSALM